MVKVSTKVLPHQGKTLQAAKMSEAQIALELLRLGQGVKTGG